MISTGGCLILLVILGIIYAVVCAFEDVSDNDFDEVTEAKCKTCEYYDVCLRHGRDYGCKDYTSDKALGGKKK